MAIAVLYRLCALEDSNADTDLQLVYQFAAVVDNLVLTSVADSGPAFYFDARPDPDPTFHFDANPDPTSYFNVNSDLHIIRMCD
jgi:hypothetical protein